MKIMQKKSLRRKRRKRHVRKTVNGTPERPRLSVFRSHKNIYAQIIDDTGGRTLVTASSMDKAFSKQSAYGGNGAAAKTVGTALAEMAAEKGIKKVVFDRNGYPFHGRIKVLAEAAREGGLEF